MKQRLKTAIAENSVLFCLVIAFLLNIILEILARQSFIKVAVSLWEHPLIFLLNTAVLTFTLSIGNFFKKRNSYYCVLLFLWLFVGIANTVLLHFRTTPLCGSDFVIFTKSLDIIGLYLSFFAVILILMFIVSAILGIIFLFIKEKTKNVKLKSAIILCAISGAITISSFFHFVYKPDYTDITKGYNNNGFAYSFLNSIFDKGIDEPVGYSEKRFSDAIRIVNSEPKSKMTVKPNVIFVQLESFIDVSYLKNIEFSENPTPNFTRLKSEFSHGFLRVPTVGGGTANTEFEVLTGLSMKFFGAGEYPFETVLKRNTCESIAYNLKDYGYSAHALHNHTGDFYYRNEVYANLGFDNFVSSEYMNGIKRNEMNWANDSILTEYIMKALDSTENSDFVFAVSVQAHGNYPKEKVCNNYPVSVKNTGTIEDKYRYSYYAKEIKETDKFIGELITAVEKRDEPTVIVFYGDHLPALKIDNEDLENGEIFETEYVIWDNIGLQKENKDLTSYQLSSVILERIGVNTGAVNKINIHYKDNPEYEKFLEVIAYDIFRAEDKKKYITYYDKTEMNMGIDKIEITSADKKGGVLTVKGQGFTPSSAICTEGNILKTDFISENEIVAYEAYKIKENSSIKIKQISQTKETLSETEAFFNIE